MAFTNRICYFNHYNVYVYKFISRYNICILATLNAVRMFNISIIMMPATPLGLNQFPFELIPHGTVMNNTFRQVSGSVRTAALVTVMATGATNDNSIEGAIHGVNMSFIVATFISVVGLLLTLRLKNRPKQEAQ